MAMDSLIEAVGYQLVPMYRVIGLTAAVALLVLFLVGILRMFLHIIIRAIPIARTRGCGWWLLSSFWGTIFQVAVGPFAGPWERDMVLERPCAAKWSPRFQGLRSRGRRGNRSTGLSSPRHQRSPRHLDNAFELVRQLRQ
jgi:hypothetical protein